MKKILLVLSFYLIQANTFAQALQTKQISIFKDGNSFVVKNGKITPKENAFELKDKAIPPALNGTFWAFAPNLLSINSYSDSVQTAKQRKAFSYADLLSANLHKKVKIYLNDKSVIEGEIEKALGYTESLAIQYQLDYIASIKTTDGKWTTLNTNKIERIDFLEEPNHKWTVLGKEEYNGLKFSFSNSNPQDFNLMYLQKGISWIPYYFLELKDDKKAKLTLRTEIINEVEDLEKVDLDCVVGVPNFTQSTRLDDMVNFIKKHSNDNDNPHYYMKYQNAGNINSRNDNRYNNNAPIEGSDNNAQAINVEDLYFYPLKQVSLRKGEKAMYPLFSQEVDIAHVFECNLLNNKTIIKQDHDLSPDNTNKVYHSVKMKNNSSLPWTSALTFITKHQNENISPLGQDILKFTPSKATTYLKITESPEVQVKQTEKEIERKKTKAYYDEVTVECNITVRNFKTKDVTMDVRRQLYGELLKSELNYDREEIIVPAYNYVNYVAANLCWNFEVKANAEKSFKYTYKILVYNPHNN